MRIIQGDARSIPMLDGEVQTIVTSPPYFGLRRYGDSEDEIGAGSLDQYLADMEACSIEWRRLLDDGGVLWMNVGDSAAGSGGAGGDHNRGGGKAGIPKYRQGRVDRAPMQWLNIPHRIVEVFVANGWLYRSCISWDKLSIRPEDLRHARRPGVSHEFLFMLAKGRDHRFFADRLHPEERGSVWRFKPGNSGVRHYAPFPLDLPMRCIPLTTETGDTVLDPFSGSGTTVRAAESLGRRGVGVELYHKES